MKCYSTLFYSLLLNLLMLSSATPMKQYDVIVVGAGPAGISAIRALLEYKVNPKSVLWIDPEFTFGRIKKYAHVPSNTQVGLFLKYFTSCETFNTEYNNTILNPMKALDQEKWCPLSYLFEPLQLLTDTLRSQVDSTIGMVTHVQPNKHNGWLIEINNQETTLGKRVILATGSSPRRLQLNGPQEIPLDAAFDPAELQKWINPGDTVAVFGNAHSGILTIKNLSELPVKHIYNFYTTPVMYVSEYGHRNGAPGITSATAEWAQNNLEKRGQDSITTLYSNEENIQQYIGMCNKVIYAIGFEQNKISGVHEGESECPYDRTTGIIAPGLFGMGIAFPEGYINASGMWERRVGLNSFLAFAKKMVPTWLKS